MIDSIILHKQINLKDINKYINIFNTTKYKKNNKIKLDNTTNITLCNLTNFAYIRLHTNSISKCLQIKHIDNMHYILYANRLNKLLLPFDLTIDDFILREIHYKLDLKTDNLQEYLDIYSKGKGNYYNTRKKIYDTNGIIESVKWRTPSKKTSFESTIYNKDLEMSIKPNKFEDHLKDTLRFEIKVKKRTLENYLKKYGLTKDLDNYFDHHMRDIFFIDYLIKFIYTGDHYHIKDIRNMLKHNLNKTMLDKIIKMLKSINQNNIDHIYDKMSKQTVNKYIDVLAKHYINPLTLNNTNIDYLQSLFTLVNSKDNSLKDII